MECNAKEICSRALIEWAYAIDMYMPNCDGSYCINWTIDDARYAQRETDKAIDVVLSTRMCKNKRYKLRHIKARFAKAIKANNIDRCKQALKDVHWEFYCIIRELKAIEEV